MTKMIRMLLVGALVGAGAFAGAGVAQAQDADCDTCVNQQDGDNEASTTQAGSSNSGDAVGGQVVGVVSSGDASVDARNRSERVDIETGETEAENAAAAFVGLNSSTDTDIGPDDAEADTAVNQQEGDNEYVLDQSADATSGDGVGGQVIGVVTSAGGSADIVADNGSRRIDIETGVAEASNTASAFVGLNRATEELNVGDDDVEVDTSVVNQQDGDNMLEGTQEATASSGDGVGGQVLGVVSAGDASIDARNRSERVELETGEASAENIAAAFVGLNSSTDTDIGPDDAEADTAVNQQNGDNEGTFAQTADASSGDAVGGQVAGVVTSAGGSADLVLDNGSLRIDGETGATEFSNEDSLFVGLTNGLFLNVRPG